MQGAMRITDEERRYLECLSKGMTLGTAELRLNEKAISVAYSRRKIRDPKTGQQRKIFGGLVPYGEVWRICANEATTQAFVFIPVDL
jgi:Protein of unknown function (DUF2911)